MLSNMFFNIFLAGSIALNIVLLLNVIKLKRSIAEEKDQNVVFEDLVETLIFNNVQVIKHLKSDDSINTKNGRENVMKMLRYINNKKKGVEITIYEDKFEDEDESNNEDSGKN